MNPVEIQAIVAGVLFGLGVLLKRALPDEKFQNRWIPLVLVVIGTPLYAAIAKDWDVLTLCAGFMAACTAVGVHQTVQQTTGKNI